MNPKCQWPSRGDERVEVRATCSSSLLYANPPVLTGIKSLHLLFGHPGDGWYVSLCLLWALYVKVT